MSVTPIQSGTACKIITLMDNIKITEKHKKELIQRGIPLERIKQRADGRYYIYIHRRQYVAPTMAQLIAKLHATFIAAKVIPIPRSVATPNKEYTLSDLYEEWMLYRRDIGTAPKTLRENYNEWQSYVADKPIASMELKDIDVWTWESYFYSITTNYTLTAKRLCNVKSMLSLMYRYALSRKRVDRNIIKDVDYSQYRHRLKSTPPMNKNFSLEERRQIIGYIAGSYDPYDMAIYLAFCLCLRIGELLALKYEDYDSNTQTLRIWRSQRVIRQLNDDMSFGPTETVIEERIKGNTEYGYRLFPLTAAAANIIERAHRSAPEQEYLFMRYGKTLRTEAFNRRLKRICQDLDIPYRSSHQIRFTVATLLYANGIHISELSYLLGHSDTRTTWHYIRQAKASDDTAAIVRKTLE